MTDNPKDEDKLPDAEAEARFKALVGNLVNTPHKPHKPPPKDETTRPET
jgi:hypothetical protein